MRDRHFLKNIFGLRLLIWGIFDTERKNRKSIRWGCIGDWEQVNLTPKKRLLSILEGEEGLGKVCLCVSATPTIAQMKAVNAFWPAAHYAPESLARLAAAGHEIVGFTGVRIPFDMCVEAEALGCVVKSGSIDRNPWIAESLFADFETFEIPDNFLESGRMPVVLKAFDILREKYREAIPIFPALIGPYTILSHLFGVENLLKGMIKNPEKINMAISRVTSATLTYGSAFIQRGSKILVISDPLASGSLIGSEDFSSFILPYYKLISKGLKSKIILHICGNTTQYLELLPQSGFEGFSFEGPAVDARLAVKTLRGKMIPIGNISTETLLFGKPGDVREETIYAMESGIDIIAPACAIPPRTPLINLQTMVKEVEKYNAKNGVG